jgi:transcription elongation factor GreA
MTNQQPHNWSARQLGERGGAQNGGRAHPSAPLMTSAGLEQLQGELAQLRQRVSDEIAQRLREARSYGDGSNNDEYHAVREEQMVMEARIAALEDAVTTAVVLDPEAAGDGVAVIGSTVSVEDLASGDRSRHRLASAHSADRGVISAASPLGHGLMGAMPGTVVTVDLPRGRSRSVRVLAVEGPVAVDEAA